MITDFKIFEKMNIEPEVGDWVLLKTKPFDDNIINIIKNNPGKVVSHIGNEYRVFYKDLKKFIEFETIPVYRGEFIYCSKNKENVELQIATKKYNL